MDYTPHNPHDALFKEFFGRPALAADFLENNLPGDVAAVLDFSSIQPVPESFIGPGLERYFADLVFECLLKDGKEASVYLLLEHKSSPEAGCAIQLLRYMVQLWERHLKANEGPPPRPRPLPLPVVIPLVLYHGKDAWRGKPLRGLFAEDPTLAAFIPDYRMLVYDLSHIPEEAIQGHLESKAVLLLWKALLSEAPLPKVAQLVHLLWSARHSANVIKTIELFLRYLLAVEKHIKVEEIEKELLKLPEGELIMRDIVIEFAPEAYKKGMLDGVEQGKAEGIETGVRDTLLALAKARFGALPAELADTVAGVHDLERLNRLSICVVTTESLAAFQADVERILRDR